MVAEKDFNAPTHPELESVPNLQVRLNIFGFIHFLQISCQIRFQLILDLACRLSRHSPPWSLVVTWRNSSLGDTSTGAWPTRESSTFAITFTFHQKLFPPPSRDSLRERPDLAHPLHQEPEASSPRPTERLTERLMTRPEPPDLDQLPWNLKEDSVVESHSSNFLVFCYFMSS